VIILITLLTISVSCVPKQDIRDQFRKIAQPYAFDFVTWEFHALSSLPQEIWGKEAQTRQDSVFRSQIIEVLEDNSIPVVPPLLFKITKPPHLLVISPREEIFYFDRILLREELSDAEKERIEAQIDALGFSSLVAGLGGFGGTYPPIIGDFTKKCYTISVIAEEWFHQYLAFRPLGFLYLLDGIGIIRSQEIVTMNETFVGMVSDEISSDVCALYYPDERSTEADRKTSDFDFGAEMRETRKKADWYLAKGEIEEAEQYMEQRRKMFEENGYYIRKLNQAYFAFHGVYGADPGSVSPIYEDLKELRARSETLGSFIERVAAMKNYNELRDALAD
jgi:hypothetical protein